MPDLNSPSLGWNSASYHQWIQLFCACVLELWLKYRYTDDCLLRGVLGDLFYVAREGRRSVRQAARRDKTVLWRKCFFLFCKYREAVRLLHCVYHHDPRAAANV